MTREQLYNAAKYLRVKPCVAEGRIYFDKGGTALRKALDESPELETELILRDTVHNPELLFAIKETASNRWADGYSDSLYMAVLSNIKETGEPRKMDGTQPVSDWDKELERYID